MTDLPQQSECDRCGAIFKSKNPKTSVYTHLPAKTLIYNRKESFKPQNNSTFIMFPLMPGVPLPPGLTSNEPKDEDTFLEFCNDCEISLIHWFNIIKYNKAER